MEICDVKQCTGCGVCASVCPFKCISMKENFEGFYYPEVDESRCAKCGKCVRTCPNHCAMEQNAASFYMGWHKSLEVLRKSSSGGAFTALAEWILEKGGVVFGAAFDRESRRIRHTEIQTKNDLDTIRLSKYYQGYVGQCYEQCKQALKTGPVLFSGTACQIAGLYTYLGKQYEQLYTVDVLCHGVASKKVVDAYIRSKEKRYSKKIVDYRFRVKPEDSDWFQGGGTRMRLDFADGTHVVENKKYDTFFVGFNQYLFVRNSCYQCLYTGTNRVADFTLADYWGVPDSEIGEREKRYGVSLILANSAKAKLVVKKMNETMEIRSIDPEKAINGNQALRSPSSPNPYREDFFRRLSGYNYDRLIFRYYYPYFIKQRAVDGLKYFMGETGYQSIRKMLKG
ncbi:MAG: Coenzyme F420 hydrogenase/dehydrogenase, beta subunit C-terminal domain [Clostridia bacterium]|nr:Coenzyme F420 hydrogenase/dehydrogenase, beta subunit C-terminal domain [Clostridia bacterium]